MARCVLPHRPSRSRVPVPVPFPPPPQEELYPVGHRAFLVCDVPPPAARGGGGGWPAVGSGCGLRGTRFTVRPPRFQTVSSTTARSHQHSGQHGRRGYFPTPFWPGPTSSGEEGEGEASGGQNFAGQFPHTFFAKPMLGAQLSRAIRKGPNNHQQIGCVGIETNLPPKKVPAPQFLYLLEGVYRLFCPHSPE